MGWFSYVILRFRIWFEIRRSGLRYFQKRNAAGIAENPRNRDFFAPVDDPWHPETLRLAMLKTS
jgi:hypothetical protein